jgi:DNA-binding GntR family transcriptional regulator
MQVTTLPGSSPGPARPPSPANRGNRIVRTSSAAHIALHIRTLIFDGVLRPGMRVPQDAIAQDLGVSRIPVREALIVLEHEGWVTIEMHRGAFINALDKRAVQDHYELYGLVYGFAAQRAMVRGDDDLADSLADLQRRFAQATRPDEQQQLSIAFHGTIVRAAASPRINVVLRAMSSLVPGDFFALVPAAVDVERRGLAAIVRAVKKRDGAQASTDYARMMRQVGNKVILLFDERSLFSAELVTA